MDKKKVFVSIPTNVVKRYCQKEFYNNLFLAVKATTKAEVFVHVCDNSSHPNGNFNTIQVVELNKMFPAGGMKAYNIEHIKITRDWSKNDPKNRARLFSKNLNTSIIHSIRDFLKSGYDYFISLESDVVPPPSFIDMFLSDCEKVESQGDKMYGIGGIYYKQNNVHKPEWFSGTPQFIKCDQNTLNLLVWGVSIFPRSFMQFMEDKKYWEDMLGVYKVKPGMFVDGMCNKRMKDWDINRYINTAIRCDHLHDNKKQRGLGDLN